MKTNIKMRVTPEQLEKICKIVGEGWLYFKSAIYMYIFIDGSIEVSYSKENWNKYNLQEIDADLFIRTNGTCKEKISEKIMKENTENLETFIKKNNYENISDLKRIIVLTANKHDILEIKLKKKNEILKKARIKRKNQREELHKLNLKLQKCISLEEHNKIVEKINKDNVNYLSNNILSRDKEIDKLKAVIEYLESKVK